MLSDTTGLVLFSILTSVLLSVFTCSVLLSDLTWSVLLVLFSLFAWLSLLLVRFLSSVRFLTSSVWLSSKSLPLSFKGVLSSIWLLFPLTNGKKGSSSPPLSFPPYSAIPVTAPIAKTRIKAAISTVLYLLKNEDSLPADVTSFLKLFTGLKVAPHSSQYLELCWLTFPHWGQILEAFNWKPQFLQYFSLSEFTVLHFGHNTITPP